MNKKRIELIIVSFTIIFMLSSVSLQVKADYSLIDTTQDLIHLIDGVTQATNVAIYPEIDIVSLVINESTITVTFVEAPIYSIDNFYDMIIYWNGDEHKNFTSGHWIPGNTNSQTCLVDSTGQVIVNITIYDSIELIGNTLYYPILNASLINSISLTAPGTGIMDTRHRNVGADFYRDVLDFGTKVVPGFNSLIASTSLIAMVLVVVFIKKRREGNH